MLNKNVTFVDVRSDGEWDGSNSRGNKRVGHVPGAIHVEWTNFLKEDKYLPSFSVDQMIFFSVVSNFSEWISTKPLK